MVWIETIPVLIIADSAKMSTPSYVSKDLDTNVSVSIDNTMVPLDTKIKATKITSREDYERIINILNVTDNETFNLELLSSTLKDNIRKIDNGKFLVRISITSSLNGKDLVVYFVKEDNSVEEHEVKVIDGYVQFETNNFSI